MRCESLCRADLSLEGDLVKSAGSHAEGGWREEEEEKAGRGMMRREEEVVGVY